MTALNLGNILNAGFDQIFNLYNPIVYETADIIDTYVYRIGMVERQYSIGTRGRTDEIRYQLPADHRRQQGCPEAYRLRHLLSERRNFP